ncbi:MAG: ABC transporter permease [Acidimicrobiia bacterium]
MTSDIRLTGMQVRYQNKIFWRTPVAAFFTLVFPLMFLIIFTATFGNDTIEELGVTTAQFYAPALAAFAAVSATYTNLAVSTAFSRDEGVLKRVRGTPLPPWMYMAGRVGSAVWLALIATVMMMTVGVFVYGVEVIPGRLLAGTVAFGVGVAVFAALGLMVAGLVSNGESATAIANATLLPLAFFSDVFIAPSRDAPEWISRVADFFPLKHFVVALSEAFNPTLGGSGFAWNTAGEHSIGVHVAVLLLWGLGAILIALRYFRWEPRSGGGSGRGSRRARRSEGTDGMERS